MRHSRPECRVPAPERLKAVCRRHRNGQPSCSWSQWKPRACITCLLWQETNAAGGMPITVACIAPRTRAELAQRSRLVITGGGDGETLSNGAMAKRKDGNIDVHLCCCQRALRQPESGRIYRVVHARAQRKVSACLGKSLVHRGGSEFRAVPR